MKVLLLGATGKLGSAFTQLAETNVWPIGWTLVPVTRAELSLENTAVIEPFVREYAPDLVVNAAAYTQVDQAEKDQVLCRRLNVDAPEALARVCKELEIPLIHFSSDYVYEGKGEHFQSESEPSQPLNFYGQSKSDGDCAIIHSGCEFLIFRTSWVYSHHGESFLSSMLKLGRTQETLEVVSDQVGAPTYAPDLAKYAYECFAKALEQKIETGRFQSGVYHLVNSGSTSWQGFAEAIFSSARKQGLKLKVKNVLPISTEEYAKRFQSQTRRPLNSRLSMERLKRRFELSPRSWEEALEECIERTERK